MIRKMIRFIKKASFRLSIRFYSQKPTEAILKQFQLKYEKEELSLCQASTLLYKLKNQIPLTETDKEILNKLLVKLKNEEPES